MQENMNIANLAKGALIERADIEIQRVLDNISDLNTDWRKIRKVTLTVDFKALDESRESVIVDLQAKSSVAPYNAVRTNLWLGKDNSGNVVAEEYVKGTMPGQVELDSKKVINMKK